MSDSLAILHSPMIADLRTSNEAEPVHNTARTRLPYSAVYLPVWVAYRGRRPVSALHVHQSSCSSKWRGYMRPLRTKRASMTANFQDFKGVQKKAVSRALVALGARTSQYKIMKRQCWLEVTVDAVPQRLCQSALEWRSELAELQ
uniref:Uncharacterized protein n=1 Tax=Parascaris univalens TaxID=6257 RepID=A0A915CLC2_PARUN